MKRASWIQASILVLLLISFSTCSQDNKRSESAFGSFFPIPPDITTIDGDDPYQNNIIPPIADIYWDNTLSQIGYAKNQNNEMKASGEFVQFYRAIANLSVGANYRPKYWTLQPDKSGLLKWTDTEYLAPGERRFYVEGGRFENQEAGPLTMIYNSDLINPKNLTVVITDLEEQGLNMSLLADLIRNKLLKTDDYAAAVIAIKLPFNGINYRPDPAALNRMVNVQCNGYKPLYAIISGQQEAVSLFIRRFSEQTENLDIKWNILTTTQSGKIRPIQLSNITIPQSVHRNELTRFIKNKYNIKDKIMVDKDRRETSISVQDRIWNLQNRTDRMVEHLGLEEKGELKHINTQLETFIFEYQPEMPRKKNDNWIWRLNLNFDMPQNCSIEELKTEIKNYRYLTKNESEDVLKWQKNNLFISRDIEAFQPVLLEDAKTVQVSILPKNISAAMESSVICFDIIVRVKQKIEIPQWVNEFDNADFSNLKLNQDRTPNFKNFINNLLKGEAAEQTVYTNDEFVKIPVVLFNLPQSKTNKRK